MSESKTAHDHDDGLKWETRLKLAKAAWYTRDFVLAAQLLSCKDAETSFDAQILLFYCVETDRDERLQWLQSHVTTDNHKHNVLICNLIKPIVDNDNDVETEEASIDKVIEDLHVLAKDHPDVADVVMYNIWDVCNAHHHVHGDEEKEKKRLNELHNAACCIYTITNPNDNWMIPGLRTIAYRTVQILASFDYNEWVIVHLQLLHKLQPRHPTWVLYLLQYHVLTEDYEGALGVLENPLLIEHTVKNEKYWRVYQYEKIKCFKKLRSTQETILLLDSVMIDKRITHEMKQSYEAQKSELLKKATNDDK